MTTQTKNQANRNNVTIYHVAEKAGVSIATVSRVLNYPHRVNEETRQRVLDAIDQLSYVPKTEATVRARRSDKRIGILAPFFTYPSFVHRLRGIADALTGTSVEMVIYNVDSTQRYDGFLSTLPISRRLDGLILMSVLVDKRAVNRLITHDLQTVMIETSNPSLCGVEIDNVHGGELAAEYLIEKGHDRIAFVGGDIEIVNCTPRTTELRLKGFKRALQAADIPVEDNYIVNLSDDYTMNSEYDREAARMRSHALFDQEKPPTAIFAANDTLAIGVSRAARDRGLHIPDDVAIIGFDNLDVAEMMGLSTIDQSLYESGRIAVELLQSRFADPTRTIQHVRLPLSVIERDTT